jgi:hypothetical protein
MIFGIISWPLDFKNMRYNIWNGFFFLANPSKISNFYLDLDITTPKRVTTRPLVWEKKWKQGFENLGFQFEGKKW